VASLACARAEATPDTPVLRVDSRLPVRLALVSASPDPSQVGFAEIERALDAALGPSTRLRTAPIEIDVGDCGGRLACIAVRVADAHVTSRADLALVVAIHAAAGQPDLVAALLIDASLAQATSDSAKAQGLDPDETDALFDREVVLVRPPRVTLAKAADLASYAKALVEACAPAPEPRGLLRGGGAVRVAITDRSTLELDGEVIGVVDESTVLTDIQTGTHTISAVDATGRRTSRIVRVLSRAISTVELDPPVASSTPWAGAFIAVGGVALTVAGIVMRANVARPAVDCMSGSTAFVCAPVSFDRLTSGSGPLTIPLGYSLIAAGLVLVAGPDLAESTDLDPRWWWAIAAGVLAASYGISEAVN